MVDATKPNEKLKVAVLGKAGPCLWVPEDQVADVQRLLDSHRVPYEVDTFSMSIDDEPAQVMFDFDADVDSVALQALLDGQP